MCNGECSSPQSTVDDVKCMWTPRTSVSRRARGRRETDVESRRSCLNIRSHVRSFVVMSFVLFTRVSCPRLRFVIHGDPSITGAAQPLQPRARSIVFGGSNSYSYSLFDFALSQSCRSIVGPFSSRPAGLGPLVYILYAPLLVDHGVARRHS